MLPVVACAVLLYFPRREHLLLTGEFHRVAHLGRGTVGVFQRPDGSRVLRLNRLETDDSPALQVILVAAADASENDSVRRAGFVVLGPLRGASISASFDVPPDLDLNRYHAVTIWNTRYEVNFLTAPVRP